MKTNSRGDPRRFELRLLQYEDAYYLDRIPKLEKMLSRNPQAVQIEMAGVGEIPADAALRIRALLIQRSPRTRIVTNAQSSLQNSSVLVWLLGDTRIIRPDARLFFRSADLSEAAEIKPDEVWKGDAAYRDSFSEADPEEGDYARVLEVINEFLPVGEFAGRLIGVPVLKQFGLVDHEPVDHFLATAFAATRKSAGTTSGKRKEAKARRNAGPRSRPKPTNDPGCIRTP